MKILIVASRCSSLIISSEMVRNQKEAKRIQGIVRRDSPGDTIELKQVSSELKEMTSFLRNILEHYLVVIKCCKEHKVEIPCPLSLVRMVDEFVDSSESKS